MDVLDVIPFPPGPDPPRGRDRRDDLANGAVVFGLPLVELLILTVTDLSKRPEVAMLWLPVLFTLAGAMICVLARVSLGRSVVALLGCLWWCLVAGTTLVVIDILIFPF
jgi:hypothetical protein